MPGAIKSTWQTIEAFQRIDDDTARITMTDIGLGHPSEPSTFYELTGLGGSGIFEGLRLTLDATPDNDNIDLTGFVAANLVCPDIAVYSVTRRDALAAAVISDIAIAKTAATIDDPTASTVSACTLADNEFDDLVATFNAGNDHTADEATATGLVEDMVTVATGEEGSGDITQNTLDLCIAARATYYEYTDYINGAIEGGMIRYQDTSWRPYYEGAMRVIFGQHEIVGITSTGSTDAEYVIDNATKSNRALTHEMAGGQDHDIDARLLPGKMVTAAALVDVTCEPGTLINFQAEGASGDPVNVTYPVIVDRYTLEEAPADGLLDAYDTPVPHCIVYLPPILTGTDTGGAEDEVKITLINPDGGTADIAFSELILANYWTPEQSRAANYDYGSQTTRRIVSNDTARGNVLYREAIGVDHTRKVKISMMDEQAAAHIDLLSQCMKTVIIDSRPNGNGERWRLMAVGLVTGGITIEETRTGKAAEVTILDTKLSAGI